MKIKIVLCIPSPKLNPNARSHWRVKGKAKTEYREHACEEAMVAASEQGISQAFKLPVVLIEHFNNTRRLIDGDNLLAAMKSAFDGFSDAGIWSDDRFCFYFPVIRNFDGKNPRVEVTIFEDLPPDYDQIIRRCMSITSGRFEKES